MRERIAERLKEEDVLNTFLRRIDPDSPIQRLLDQVNFRLKVFDTQDPANDKANLGFEYGLEKSVLNWSADPSQQDHPIAINFDFHSRGNVAFDQDVNPSDFLDTGLRFDAFQFRSGVNTEKEMEAGIEAVWAEHLQRAAQLAAEVEGTPEQVDRSPEWKAFMASFEEAYLKRAGTEVLWSLAADGALESDQSFTTKQYAYGLQAGLLVRAWSSEALLAKLNVFDYPFAVLRYLTGADERFQPSGQAFPSFLAGLDLVDPVNDPDREAVTGDEEPYPRFSSEIAMRSKVSSLGGQYVWFSATWRYFRELGAEADVRAAGLDDQSYFAASLEFPQGWVLTYATGRLPLDLIDDDVWELGFNFEF